MILKNTKDLKQKILIPIVVFIVSCIILLHVLYASTSNYDEHIKTTTELNAITYSERLIENIDHGIDITNSLEQVIISNDGQINNFDTISANLLSSSIQSIQLAPDGVVTDIYPEAGNEAGKIDLINDSARGEISRYGRDNNVLIAQGPFSLKQGGNGIAIRNPVYITDSNSETHFWGFTIVIIRVPEIFSSTVQSLSNFGYDYCLSKTASPFDTEYKEIYSSGRTLINPVNYTFELGGCTWKLEVMPSNGWYDTSRTVILSLCGFGVVLLLTGLTFALLVLDGKRKQLKTISTTDFLTGLTNRTGLDEQLDIYSSEHKGEPCVCIILDIDNFKFINDIYGHATGDNALINLADSMREYFPDNSILCRNGGDEFCIILKNCSCSEVEDKITEFTNARRTFTYNDTEYDFSISAGYAEYPAQADNMISLMSNADAALYEVKLRGKHSCLSFDNNFDIHERAQLGFALKDISENVPCAFIIYKADINDDRILYANNEMINLAGCSDMNELMEFTHQSFNNLINDTERNKIISSIWNQVTPYETTHKKQDDFVLFNLNRKDGTTIPVYDHGRIVGNSIHGDVFYVIIIEADLIKNYEKHNLSQFQ